MCEESLKKLHQNFNIWTSIDVTVAKEITHSSPSTVVTEQATENYKEQLSVTLLHQSLIYS